MASGIKSSLAGLTVISGGLAAPLPHWATARFGLGQAATGATTSYVLGQGAKTYLRQGCQWGPRGIKTVIQQILAAGQGRLGDRPASRRPQEAAEVVIGLSSARAIFYLSIACTPFRARRFQLATARAWAAAKSDLGRP